MRKRWLARGVFRTQLIVYDGAFLREQLLAVNYFHKKISIVDVRLASKHASARFKGLPLKLAFQCASRSCFRSTVSFLEIKNIHNKINKYKKKKKRKEKKCCFPRKRYISSSNRLVVHNTLTLKKWGGYLRCKQQIKRLNVRESIKVVVKNDGFLPTRLLT